MHVYLRRNPSVGSFLNLTLCFCVRIELVFERNTKANHSFQGGDGFVWSKKVYLAKLRNMCISWRKPSEWEEWASSTLFLCENWVTFWKIYILQITVSKMEQTSCHSEQAYSTELKKCMYLLKETHVWSKKDHLAHCFPVRVELVFERNTSYN
jgi:hypothetical protein